MDGREPSFRWGKGPATPLGHGPGVRGGVAGRVAAARAPLLSGWWGAQAPEGMSVADTALWGTSVPETDGRCGGGYDGRHAGM